MSDRIICGWRVRSDLPLPETAPWTGPDRAVDIEIRAAAIPAHIGERNAELPYLEIASDGRLLIDAGPVARFLVTPNRIIVDTPLDPDAPDWRACLLGPVLAIVCYLRGTLPLHASALRMGDRAFAIAGRSGAGKSTLAAALARRGYVFVTDDICACTGFPRQPLVQPSYPAIKLTAASLDALGIDGRGLSPIGPDFEKVQLPQPAGYDPSPLPLDAVYLIEDAEDDSEDRIIHTDGVEGFQRVTAEIYRPPIGRLLLAKPRFFAMATQLATGVSIRRLVRRRDLRQLAALVEAIESDLIRA
ncbi:MAG TPA: hypothetical protein VGF92_18380 [Stellaceae bacterium]|jgi:hypothetical protein